jgi:GTP cyclohydrolase I
MHFPYFIDKEAPISKVRSLMDYEVTLVGEILPGGIYRQSTKVVVPATSLCPCSKKISERGAHNQRSHVTITATTNEFVWIEEIVQMAEGQASCEVFGLLKRPDEKYVTERAYDNPSSSRTWCAMWPGSSTPIDALMPISSNRRTSSPSTTIPHTR